MFLCRNNKEKLQTIYATCNEEMEQLIIYIIRTIIQLSDYHVYTFKDYIPNLNQMPWKLPADWQDF